MSLELCLAIAAEERHRGLHSLPLVVLVHTSILHALLPFIEGPPIILQTPVCLPQLQIHVTNVTSHACEAVLATRTVVTYVRACEEARHAAATGPQRCTAAQTL